MISSLGFSSEDHIHNFEINKSEISKIKYDFGEYFVSAIQDSGLISHRIKLQVPNEFSRFESLAVISIDEALRQTNEISELKDVQLILASTKGNIDLMDQYDGSPGHPLHLISSAKRIQGHFNLSRTPLIISNACTSGLMAIIMACRMIRAGQLRHAIVCGVDILSEFTLKGFSSLQAMDKLPCRPFDANREGVTLGEGCATAIISSVGDGAEIEFLGGGINNDANHISGPSRTGEGLKKAIHTAIQTSNHNQIDLINAHGTGTRYNDEMEAQAFNGLSMQHIPTQSLKGYWGHTLGAAGILETLGAVQALKTNRLYKSVGYEEHGLTLPLNIIEENKSANLTSCLKTSSGFGGSNAALVIRKR